MTSAQAPETSRTRGTLGVLVSTPAHSQNWEEKVELTLSSILRSSVAPCSILITYPDSTPLQDAFANRWMAENIQFLSQSEAELKNPALDLTQSLTHEFIHWLESGDEVDVDFYQECIRNLQIHSGTDVVCGTATPAMTEKAERIPFTRDAFTNSTGYRITCLIDNPVTFSRAVFRTQSLKSKLHAMETSSVTGKHQIAIALTDLEWGLVQNAEIIVHPENSTLAESMNHCEESAIAMFERRGPLYFLPHLREQPRGELYDAALQLVHICVERDRPPVAHAILSWLAAQPELASEHHAQLVDHFSRVGDLDSAKEHLEIWLQAEPTNRAAIAAQHDIYPPAYRGRQPHHTMSVLLILHAFPPTPYAYGGTELYTYNLALQLQKQGIHVTVMYPLYSSHTLALGSARQTSFDGIDIIQVHIENYSSLLKTFWDPELGKSLAAYVETMNFDIAHMQYPLGFSLVLMDAISRYTTIKTAFTLHDANIFCAQSHLRQSKKMTICDGPQSPQKCTDCHIQGTRRSVEAVHQPQVLPKLFDLRSKQTKEIIRNIDQTFVPTQFLMSYLESYDYPLENVYPTTLGMPLFNKLPKIESSKIRFMFLGNLITVKGVDILLEAFASIDDPNIELHLHGRAFQETMLENLHEYLSRPNVFYHGRYQPSQLPQILQNADVGIIPSLSENYPTVVREFFNADVPVIGSRVGGIPELIDDGVNGYLFTVGDVDELRDRLERVIRNPELIKRLQEGIQPVMSIEMDALRTFQAYEQLVRPCEKLKASGANP